MSIIAYDDLTHIYSYKGVRYLSATQILSKFKNKFDAKAVAADQEIRTGIPAATFIKTWDTIRDTSLVRGNRIHNLHEEIVKNRSIDVMNGTTFKVINTEMYPSDIPLQELPDGIYTEEILYRHDYRIAGRADKFALDTLLNIRFAHIDDYKTNRVIKTQSFCHPVTGHKMMLGPLSHLQDCEMVHYTLQLSLYQFMLEYHGFHAGTRRIIHFPHILPIAPEGAEPPPPVFHEVPYWRDEVIDMLEHLKLKIA